MEHMKKTNGAVVFDPNNELDQEWGEAVVIVGEKAVLIGKKEEKEEIIKDEKVEEVISEVEIKESKSVVMGANGPIIGQENIVEELKDDEKSADEEIKTEAKIIALPDEINGGEEKEIKVKLPKAPKAIKRVSK
jgi:hypothetical protein